MTNCTLAITMGCPVGIGPEIILKNFLQSPKQRNSVVLGDIGILQRAAQELKLEVPISPWQPGSPLMEEKLQVLELSTLPPQKWGVPTAETGRAAGTYIVEAVRGCQNGLFAGIVTAPISKASLNQAGFHFPGHTEMLAQLTGSPKVAMMMAGNKLRVTLVTLHTALDSIATELSQEKIYDMIAITDQALRYELGIDQPKLAVAALNPHAGEDGLFGNQEQTIIAPAIAEARQNGITLSDPLPPDTVFAKAIAGEFDAVVCMYHDQGLIPFKLVHWSDGVNVTLGLPIVRTSVDHGTAYDIAGKNSADPRSLEAAIELAQTICLNRKKNDKR